MKTYVQQIMLGSVTSNEAQARQTLQKIKAAGYDGLELNSFMIHPTGLLVRMLTKAAGMPTGKGGKLDWRALLAESGLRISSLHTDLGSLERDASAVAAEAKSFGTDKVVITGMYRFDYGDEKSLRELAGRLNRVGEALQKEGVELLYHNHNVELLPLESGKRAYDLLIDETDPSFVGFEFDSYCRMKLWHVTDRGSRHSGAAITPILKADSMELGSGNMDLDGLLAIARENGVEDVILESHKNWIGKDPVKSLELSAQWLGERK